MLRTRRLSGSAGLAALTVAVALTPSLLAPTALADTSDGKLTVVVDLDVNNNGHYDVDVDLPQSAIKITVTDTAGNTVHGVTDSAGRYELDGSSALTGGRYFVVADIAAAQPDLAPVAESDSFAPLSTAVDVTSDDKTVRMGVAAPATPSPQQPSTEPSEQTPAARVSVDEPRFAVGDRVFGDRNRSGVQDPDEAGLADVRVQLLDSDGDVLRTTTPGASGRYFFDDLPAGTYSVRFAGLPNGERLGPARTGGDPALDSDPDYTGVTPPFTLGKDERNVRPATPEDHVRADYINPTVDAGIAPLRFAISDRVWLDVNGDGIQQVSEPPASATVQLQNATGAIVASTTTDSQGGFTFSNLKGGSYQLRFDDLPPHRAFTLRSGGSDRSADSDVDPEQGRTPIFKLAQGARGLVPAADAGIDDADYVNQTISAGIVGSYSIGDTVWRDINGDGVLDPGDGGVGGVTVQLLSVDGAVLDRTKTSRKGRYLFDKLPAGSYQVKFSGLPRGLQFTRERAGRNDATDSNVGADGVTQMVMVGDDNPADNTVDAGLTTTADVVAASAGSGGPETADTDTALSETGGVSLAIPLLGGLLVVGGAGILLFELRRTRVRQQFFD